MNKIRVIDLLNKIAKGEEVPRVIKYDNNLYFWCQPCLIYEIDGNKELCGKNLYDMLDNLNDEVEIIEENKKIEEIKWNEKSLYNGNTTRKLDVMLMSRTEQLKNGLNKIIDEVNKLKEENNE